jgi:hypothetical protein
MLEAENLESIAARVASCLESDGHLLDELRADVRPLESLTRKILPRSTTAISFVATDGGNNSLNFDPFMVQVIRVVDSSRNEYCLDAVTPNTDVARLSSDQVPSSGEATALGELMRDLGVSDLSVLSHMMPKPGSTDPPSPSWVQVYRELVEWATLYRIVKKKDFATDTIIVFDGLLRSKVFAKNYFIKTLDLISAVIEEKKRRTRRSVYIVGFAKHSKVITRYRLALFMESIMTKDYPVALPVPPEIEKKSYLWDEYSRTTRQAESQGGEENKFVGGVLHLVKFGPKKYDPIWPVDIIESQADEWDKIVGYLLADAEIGFPVPYYPRCLQKAHEYASLVDFDFDIIQDSIVKGVRCLVGDSALFDIFRLQDADPASARYQR